MTERKNHIPFDGGLNRLDIMKNEDFREGSTKIFELRKDPEVIIREEPVEIIDTESLNNAKNLFDELRGLGLAVPKIDHLIGENQQGRRIVYTVTERIHGKPLDLIARRIDVLSESDLKSLESFFETLVTYFKSKYNVGAQRIDDLGKMDQYVWGQKKGDEFKKIYLVDISPSIRTYYPAERSADLTSIGYLPNSQFFLDLVNLAHGLRDFHRKGLNWAKARSEILEFIMQNINPRDAEIHEKFVNQIQQALKE